MRKNRSKSVKQLFGTFDQIRNFFQNRLYSIRIDHSWPILKIMDTFPMPIYRKKTADIHATSWHFSFTPWVRYQKSYELHISRVSSEDKWGTFTSSRVVLPALSSSSDFSPLPTFSKLHGWIILQLNLKSRISKKFSLLYGIGNDYSIDKYFPLFKIYPIFLNFIFWTAIKNLKGTL